MDDDLMNDDPQEGDESEENEVNDRDMGDYRGYFVDEANEEEEETKYYEHNAHFPYHFLYQKLQILQREQERQENDDILLTDNNPAEEHGDHDDNDINNNHKLSFLHHNERSRNRNINNHNAFTNKIDHEKGKSHNPIHNNKINNNPIDIKKEINPIPMPNTKTDQKNVVLSSLNSKLKINKHFNFSKKKIVRNEKPVISKTIQFANKKTKAKTLVNSNCQNWRSKSKELSVSSHNNNNNNHSTNNKKSCSNNNNTTNTASNKSLPKALNNILTSYKTKQNGFFSPGVKPQNTKVVKDANVLKRESTNQSQGKTRKACETSVQTKKQLTISLEKKDRQKKKIDSPYHSSNQKEERCQTHSNNKTGSTNAKTKHTNPIRKNIQDMLFSISSNSNHISRNIPVNPDSMAKSKTNNQTERDNHLTQNNMHNNHLLTTKTMNIDISKQIPNNFLQTTTKQSQNLPPKSKTKPVPPANKMKTYQEVKYNINPKTKKNLLSEIQRSIGISSLLTKNSKYIPNEQSNKTKNNIDIHSSIKPKGDIDKKLNINTSSKGNTNYPCSSSVSTTNKQSVVGVKVPSVTTSKTNLSSKESKTFHNNYLTVSMHNNIKK